MEAFDLLALLGPSAAKNVDVVADSPSGCDSVLAPPQRHKIDASVSGIYSDTLAESTRLEAIRDLLLLQNAAAGGVNIDTLLGKATNVLRNKLAAASHGQSPGEVSLHTFTTKRAFKEVDTHVSWLAHGLEVAANIRAAAQAQNWSTGLGMLGEFHTSVLTHDTVEAYTHIYPISKVCIPVALHASSLSVPEGCLAC